MSRLSFQARAAAVLVICLVVTGCARFGDTIPPQVRLADSVRLAVACSSSVSASTFV